MWRKALIIGMVAVAAIGAGSFWYTRSQAFITAAATALSTEATKALNTEIKIDQLQIKSLTTITADGITINDKTGAPLATAQTVDISFSPIGMISGRPVIENIYAITVKKPQLYLNQRSDGVWNYSDLLPEDQSSTDVFSGKVSIEDGTAEIIAADKEITAQEVTGTLDFAGQPSSVRLDLSFKNQGGSAAVSGTLGGSHQALSVKAKAFNLENYLAFLPKDLALQLKAGVLGSLDVTVLKGSSDYEVDGEAVVLGVKVDVEGTEVEKIDGLLLFNEKELRVFSRGEIKGQPIVLRGTARLDLAEPILDLQVSSKGFDASQVLDNFPLEGKIAFHANIGGTLDAPIAEGTFTIPEAQLYTYTLRDAQAKLKFADDVVLIDQAEASVFGGTVNVHGQIDTKNEKYTMQVKTQNVEAAQLTAFVDGVSGHVNVDLTMSGQGTDLSNALVYGSAALLNGQYQGIAFNQADVSFYKQANRTVIDYLTIALPEGKISADGHIEGDRLALKIYGYGIEIAQASQVQPQLQLRGLAAFSGTITGSIKDPNLQAELSAENGEFFGQPYQRAQGQIIANQSNVTIERFDLIDGVTRHSAKGSIGLTGNKALQLQLTSTQARMENIVKIVLPGEQLTGNVDNQMMITGTLDDINAEGEVRFSDGSFRGTLLTKAVGKYQRKNGQTMIEDFIISAPNLNVKLNGIVKADQDLDFDIVADDINVSKLRLQLPYPVSGKAKFIGKLQGNLDSPIFNGILTADHLMFNGQDLASLDGRISFKDNVIDLESFAFKQGAGTFDLSAGIDLNTKQIYGNLAVKQGELGAILSIINLKNDWINGKLDGTIRLSGTSEHPKVRLAGYMGEGNLRDYPLNHIALDVALDDKIVTIHEFRAEQGAGLLVAKGAIDFAGAMNVEIAGQNIDAGLLTNLAKYDADTKGTLSFGAQIGGTAANPQANLSMDIQGGGVGNATFDTLYGLFTLTDGIINVDQLLLQKGEYKASAYGIIPLAAITTGEKELVDLKEQMDLKISLDQADLSILPFLTKEVDWAMGPTKGGITVSGTLMKPLFNGGVTVDSGAVKFRSIGKPVEKMLLDIQFSNDQMDLKTFEGTMGKGSYQMTGTSRITGSGLEDYNFLLKLNKLEISSKYYTGPLEGEIALTADQLAKRIVPKLAGHLNFENCIVDIPTIPDSEDEMPILKLDLDVNIGKKVRLYNSFLYDILLEGHVNFGGSTRRPQTSGEISAVRGTVSYLKTPFKIQEATAYFNQVNSFLPSLTLEADTRLERTKVYLNINGPADKMQIKLSSDSEMNEAEILSLLTLRSRYYDKNNAGDSGIGKDELVTLLDLGLQMSFLSEVEGVVRNALGVDEFKLVRDTLALTDRADAANFDREVYNIEIGKYVTDKLMLKYTTGIDHDSYKVGVQYDFNSKISLTSDIDQDNKSRIGIEARFKF